MDEQRITGGTDLPGGTRAGGTGRQPRAWWKIAVLGTVVGAAVGAVGLAAADSPAPAPAASTASTPLALPPWAPGGPWGPWGPGRFPGRAGITGPVGLFDWSKSLHGEVVTAKDGGGTQTLLIQRGQVTSASAGSLSLKSSDGYTATYRVTGDSLVNGEKNKVAGLANGTDLVVVAVKGDGDAVLQQALDPALCDWPGAPTPAPTNS